MNKLAKLIDLCGASVTVTANDHKSYYQSVKSALFDDANLPPESWQAGVGANLTPDLLKELDVTEEVLNGMIEKDTIISVQYYPRTPVGFCRVYHYDLDLALDECLKNMESLGDE